MQRRTFLLAAAGCALPLMGVGYGIAEASAIRVVHQKISVRRLPKAFAGLRVAFLTDIHHGPYDTVDHLTSIVRTTQTLQPDVILLGGDYILRDAKYIEPCFDVLKELAAPLGVYGVLGNHDYTHGISATKRHMEKAQIHELTNEAVWLQRGTERIRLAGVDDLWRGKTRVQETLEGTSRTDCCLMLSHNPDVAETMTDRRVSLMLSGHTHGGQVLFPGYGSPFVPSHYGQKYASGLVQAPTTDVYVSRGLGVTALPIRIGCPPELTMLELQA